MPLAENILLIASGNVGKSSIINAIRFFFMPSLTVKARADFLAFMTPKKTVILRRPTKIFFSEIRPSITILVRDFQD